MQKGRLILAGAVLSQEELKLRPSNVCTYMEQVLHLICKMNCCREESPYYHLTRPV